MGKKKKYQHGISKEVSFLALWGMDTHTLTQGIPYSYVFFKFDIRIFLPRKQMFQQSTKKMIPAGTMTMMI